MLQEILLSLSGLPSPIWTKLKGKNDGDENLQDYIPLPEQAMLTSLSRLSELHIEVKDNTALISFKHPSLVCRAVSSSINSQFLANLRRKIIEIESSILQGDTAYVGGYQIVPLSTLVADFAPWTRRLEWLSKLTLLMKGNNPKKSSIPCTAAQVLDYLENERHTGFSDLADISTQLLVVAQATWMRTTSAWVLYGQLPPMTDVDFMIKGPRGENVHEQCTLQNEFIPNFVSISAAENILAIGNALRQIQSPTISALPSDSGSKSVNLLKLHLAKVKLLRFPLNPSLFESTMFTINKSVSQHALAHLLPRSQIIEICRVLQDYVLLGRGEFALSLIQNSDGRVMARQKSHSSMAPVRKLGRVEDMVLKTTELDAILAKTWSDLSAFQGQDDIEHEIFEAAKKYLKMRAVESEKKTGRSPLLATLLPTPAVLHIEIPASSPLRIFLSPIEIEQYSSINAFLLSIRRSQVHVSDLWKLTVHRRSHPTPLGPPVSTTEFGRRACTLRRRREDQRARHMRRFWSSMNKSLFLLNEFGFYIHGEIIANSWKQFAAWLGIGNHEQDHKSQVSPSVSFHEDSLSSRADVSLTSTLKENVQAGPSRDDPRSLARAHSAYLTALQSGLLMDNDQLFSQVKSFLELLDHFIALFTRLSTTWQGLDLQEDDGVVDAFVNYVQDEKDIVAEMDRARSKLEDLLEQLVKSFRGIEKAQDADSFSGTAASIKNPSDVLSEFQPWRARTLNRLIMKLDLLHDKTEATDDIFADEYE